MVLDFWHAHCMTRCATLPAFRIFTRSVWPVLIAALFGPAQWTQAVPAASDADVAAPSAPAPPIASRQRGFYDQPFTVVLKSDTVGARIDYTLNGDPPDAKGAHHYDGPIPIQTTTILRAASVLDKTNASPSVTHTYLFLSNVLRQTGEGFPATWGTNQGNPVPADYEMDPEITQHPGYRAEMVPALRALPSLSLVIAKADLFGPERGLYAHPRQTGAEWERAASIEWLSSSGEEDFKINCGARIQGGWNRRPEESPKHSFRVIFRKKYGPGKLRFPLFADPGPREFDEFILRAGCNNTWLHWSGTERRRGEFLRDEWMRESFAAMGHASARGRFVHLYLNGLYWGLYNPTERPSAPFVAWHLSGQPQHLDVRNADNVLEGDDQAWQRLLQRANAGVVNPAAYDEISDYVDIPQLIDFLLINFYGGNADWDRASNWYAARRRRPPGPFQFFVWDGERVLEGVSDNSLAANDDQSPTRLFHQLRQNETFRRQFAEQARNHLTGGGALTPAAATARYRRLAEQIDAAVLGESARWGDYRRDAHRYKEGPYELYTRDDHWRPEVRRILTEYLPQRTAVMMEQLKGAGLY
jgi:hypothetical protein